MAISTIDSTGLAAAGIAQSNIGAGVAGNGPAFLAYLPGNTNISSATATKIPLSTEVFDTNNCFDNVTNYRFQPNVAGYYLVNQTTTGSGTGVSYVGSFIYKNGAIYVAGQNAGNALTFQICSVSQVIYLNGTTDYLEFYAQINATAPYINGALVNTAASAALVRAT